MADRARSDDANDRPVDDDLIGNAADEVDEAEEIDDELEDADEEIEER